MSIKNNKIYRITLTDYICRKIGLKKNYNYLDVIEIIKESEKAYLLKIHSVQIVFHNLDFRYKNCNIWIPKSQILMIE